MKKMIITALILILAVFSISASGSADSEDSVLRENAKNELIPSSDYFDTATFGLG